MMDITSPAMLQNLMFGTAFFGATGLKGYDAAWNFQETEWVSRLVATQRKRYMALAFAQLSLAACLVGALWHYGYNATLHALHEWWTIPVIGWVVVIVNVVGCISPLITLMTWRHVYKHPAICAKRAHKDAYILTEDVRNQVRNPQTVSIVKHVDESGHRRKEYVYNG